MRKLLTLAIWLALPSLGWAQCHGYSANVQYTPLSPSDAAQRGQVTATITVQAVDGTGNPLPNAVPNHNLSVANTWVRFIYSSNNAVSTHAYWTMDSDPTQHNEDPWPLNGTTGPFWNVGSNWPGIGHTVHLFFTVTDANGNITQDRVNITAASGTGIVSQDALATNVYVQVLTTFGGGDMMDNCAECLQAPYHCIHATHTPYVTMTAVNHTSGESQALPRQVAGNIADATSSISGSGSILISALPNDIVDGTFNDEIICSVVGPFPVTGNDDWHVQFEWAWTKVSTKQNTCVAVGNGVRCAVTAQYTCSTASQIPDLNPATVFSNFPVAGMPVTPATMPPFWWTFGIGVRPRVTSFPWFFPINDLTAILQSQYSVLDILAGAFPSNSTIRDCTNYDKGFGVPSPFPPFDQP